MPNNIAVSVTADVAGLQVGRAKASAELKLFQKDLNDLVRTSKETGVETAEMKTAMLAAGDGVARAKSQINLINSELKAFAAAAKAAEVAAGGVHAGMAGVTREALVMARELSRGNFNRMAGSATILAGRLGILTPAVIGTGAVIAAILAPVVAVAAAMEGAAQDAAKFQNAIQMTGNFAGLTGDQYEDMARRVASASNVGVGTARSALLELTKSGRFTGEELEQLGRDATRMSQLTGRSSKDVLADYVKMADGPARYATEFNRTYHALSLAQIEHIKHLEDEGDKSAATAELVRDLTHWLDDQTVHMGGLAGAWHGLATGINDAWNAFKRFSSNNQFTADERISQLNARIAEMRKSGTDQGFHFGADHLAVLERTRDALQATAAAQHKVADTAAAAARTQQDGADAYEKSHQTMIGLRSSASAAAEAVKALHDEMAARLKANPNDREALDYQAHSDRYDQALRKKLDPADNKKPRAGGGESPMTAMENELRQSEFDIRQSTGDWSRDMQAVEVKFWQGKLEAARAGSKLYGEIQTRLEAAQLAEGTRTAEQNRQIAVNDITTQLDLQKAAIDDKKRAAEDDYKEARISADQKRDILAALARQEAELEIAAQEAKKQAYAHDIVAVHEAANQEQIIRAKLAADLDAIERQRTQDKIKEEEKRTAAAKKAAEEEERTWRTANNEILSAEDRLVSGIMGGRESLSRILGQIALETATKEIQADLKYLTQHMLLRAEGLAADTASEKGGLAVHLLTQTHKTAATAAGVAARTGAESTGFFARMLGLLGISLGAHTATEGAKTAATVTGAATRGAAQAAAATTANVAQKIADEIAVSGYAGEAAAATFAAYSPLALVAPGLPAGMAAAAFAQTMAFGSFAQGANVVPRDMIAQIHAGERIIPAADNSAIMSAVTGGGRGGDRNFHATFAPTIHSQQPRTIMEELEEHAPAFFGWLKRAHRDGKIG